MQDTLTQDEIQALWSHAWDCPGKDEDGETEDCEDCCGPEGHWIVD